MRRVVRIAVLSLTVLGLVGAGFAEEASVASSAEPLEELFEEPGRSVEPDRVPMAIGLCNDVSHGDDIRCACTTGGSFGSHDAFCRVATGSSIVTSKVTTQGCRATATCGDGSLISCVDTTVRGACIGELNLVTLAAEVSCNGVLTTC